MVYEKAHNKNDPEHEKYNRFYRFCWRIAPSDTFADEEPITAAATAYPEIANSNPQSMGKSKACYSQLLQITPLYARLSK